VTAEPSEPDVVVIRPTLRRFLPYLLASAAFTAVGVAMLLFPREGGRDPLIAVLAIAFFGGGALVLSILVVWRKPSVVLDSEGFEIRDRARSDKVLWKDVAAIGRNRGAIWVRLGSQDAVAKLAPTQRSTRAAALARRWTGYDIGIPRLHLDRSPKDFVELMEGYWRRAVGG
jgi:hypothetical protein